LCADVRRFSRLNNARKVFGTHRLRQRKLALVRSSLELLHRALDTVGETAFPLYRQRPDDLIDAERGGVFNRRSG
jgi:hypothetical protein